MSHPRLSLPSDLDNIWTWDQETPFHDGFGGVIPDFNCEALDDYMAQLIKSLEKREGFSFPIYFDDERVEFALKPLSKGYWQFKETINDPKADIWNQKNRIRLTKYTLITFIEWLKRLEGPQGQKWPDYKVE